MLAFHGVVVQLRSRAAIASPAAVAKVTDVVELVYTERLADWGPRRVLLRGRGPRGRRAFFEPGHVSEKTLLRPRPFYLG